MEIFPLSRTNPETKEKEEINVLKFSVDDWLNGNIGLHETDRNWLTLWCTDTRLPSKKYLPHWEILEINKIQQKFYDQIIELGFICKKNEFNKLYNKSEDRERLLLRETDKIKRTLFGNNLGLAEKFDYNDEEIKTIRKLYDFLITESQKPIDSIPYNINISEFVKIKYQGLRTQMFGYGKDPFLAGYNLIFETEVLAKYLKWLKNKNFEKKEDSETEQQEPENDLLLSTIEDWLYPFKEEKIMLETDYDSLVSALKIYFETGTFPIIANQIKVGKVNRKRFGWALNEIFRANKTNNEKLPIEYLRFAKKNISIFTTVDLNETDFLNSNLYKYLTTKTM